jgi:uncharacterized protein with FMN-binding domain
MRRIVTALLSTITAVVLLFSYHTSTDSGSPSVVAGSAGGSASGSTPETSTTPTPSATPSTASGGPDTGDDGTAEDDGAAAAAPTPTATASAAPKPQSAATKTYTGNAVDTRLGPVQVQITVTGGKVTAAQAVQYPNGNGRDVEINSYALPVLSQEAVQKQSAQIDTVSGATVTSDGYLQSLQSALDQAHL